MSTTTEDMKVPSGVLRLVVISLLLVGVSRAELVRFESCGKSMLPALPVKGCMWVDTNPEAFDRIQMDSVVVFKDPSAPTGKTAHRAFKEVKPGVWWTKGINNPLPDSIYVTRENFVGLVVTPDEAIPLYDLKGNPR